MADEAQAPRRLGRRGCWILPGTAGFARVRRARRREVRGWGALRLAIGGGRGVRAAFAVRERF